MADPLIGKKLGDYVIQELLGKGGMARVYKGYDERLQRYAAVKVIDSEIAAADHVEYRMRFEREARAIAKLDQHPNIVKVYQFGEYGTLCFMAMAFIEGKDLRQILREYNERGLRMPHADIVSVIQGIGDALDYAHSLGVIHRDVKPSNIMITPQKQAVLTDFGLVLSATDGTMGDTFGSAHYIAPEQAVSSKNAVPQSDIYSLGVCAYEMLTGRVPFDDPSAMSVALKHLHDMPPSPLSLAPELPAAVEPVIFKVLDKDPERRYASGAEFSRALALALFGGDTERLPILRSKVPSVPTLLSDSSAARRMLPTSDWTEVSEESDTLDLRHLEAKPPAKRRALPFVLLGILFLVAAIAFLALNRLPEMSAAASAETALAALSDLTATSTSTEVAISQPTGTPTSPPPPTTVRPTETPSATFSHTPSATATEPLSATVPQPTATSTPSSTHTSTATSTPSPSRTPTLTRTLTLTRTHTPALLRTVARTPTATPTPLEADILLVYDDDQLNLINVSNRTLNLQDLNFIQDGSEPYLFNASEWALTGAVRQLSAFPPRWCLKVGRIERQVETRFGECRSLASFRYTAPTKQFWRSHSTAVTTFSVRLGNQEIATCPIAAGRCAFSLSNRTSP
ncbi:MAG: protein kinase [Anaerolineae bacterium]|nr:protein kinase [Anaerolineae bacterium]